MNKSIVILETPNRCFDCPCYKGYVRHDECEILEKELIDENLWHQRPDWCPLFSIPKKRKSSYDWDEYEDGWDGGWNSCVDYIENNGKSMVLDNENGNEILVSYGEKNE